MRGKVDDLRQTKLGMATLAACIVQTLNETDQSFQARFLDRLGRAYHEYRDNSENDPMHVLELLSWTRELLTGWNPISGQGEPFLGGG